jgi:hypothetical protein
MKSLTAVLALSIVADVCSWCFMCVYEEEDVDVKVWEFGESRRWFCR